VKETIRQQIHLCQEVTTLPLVIWD